MKTSFIKVAIAIGIMAMGCFSPREKTAQELLNNPKMENEIDSAIINDNVRLTKFMAKMMENENCKKMMITDAPMLKMMCLSENMDSLMKSDREMMENTATRMINFMKADTVVCDKTCTRIMEDKFLRERMLRKAGTSDEKKNSKSK